jgi:hypothetical protein
MDRQEDLGEETSLMPRSRGTCGLICAIEGDEARHQERQKKHPRDCLKQCDQPSLGRDGGDIPLADGGQRHEAKEDHVGPRQVGAAESGQVRDQRRGMDVLQHDIEGGE